MREPGPPSTRSVAEDETEADGRVYPMPALGVWAPIVAAVVLLLLFAVIILSGMQAGVKTLGLAVFSLFLLVWLAVALTAVTRVARVVTTAEQIETRAVFGWPRQSLTWADVGEVGVEQAYSVTGMEQILVLTHRDGKRIVRVANRVASFPALFHQVRRHTRGARMLANLADFQTRPVSSEE